MDILALVIVFILFLGIYAMVFMNTEYATEHTTAPPPAPALTGNFRFIVQTMEVDTPYTIPLVDPTTTGFSVGPFTVVHNGPYEYDFTIDWGDGTLVTDRIITFDDPLCTHTYATAGPHTITLTGKINGFTNVPRQTAFSTPQSNVQIIDVLEWGSVKIEKFGLLSSGVSSISATDGPPALFDNSAQGLFYNCQSLVSIGATGWDVSGMTDMELMFSTAVKFNQDISSWDVSGVTNMEAMFLNARVFNQDISGWVVSGVTNMKSMFTGASKFNQDISSWDVSGVTNMESMFADTADFNQNLSGWVVSGVTNMKSMFASAITFNGSLAGWDVSGVTNMESMFTSAITFNGSLSGWNPSSATSMKVMFDNATAFNQDISGWDVGGVTDMSGMFAGALSFEQDISGWNVNPALTLYGGFISINTLASASTPFWQTVANAWLTEPLGTAKRGMGQLIQDVINSV